MPTGDNPKYVAFSLVNTDYTKQQIIRPSGVPNPTFFDIDIETHGKNSREPQEIIIDKLRAHVKKYGTLDEIVITGHGGDKSMYSGDETKPNTVHTISVLYAIDDLEKELGSKITKRIIFSGCSVFSELDSKDIAYYRDYSVKHNMEIVSSTSYVSLAESYSCGRFVQFSPNGKIIRDKLDTRYSPLALIGDSRTWVDYHLDKTQDEVEKQLKQEIIDEAAELIRFKGIVPVGVEETMKQDLTSKDDYAERTNVLLTKDEKAAIIVSSDGMVRAKGNIKLHPLAEKEKSSELKEMENSIRGIAIIDEFSMTQIKNITAGLNSNLDVRHPDADNFTTVLLDNNKSVLIATETGGYEVVTIQPQSNIPKVTNPTKKLQK